MSTENLVTIENLHVDFESRRQKISAVRGVSLTIAPGESVALVGESGSGKTVTARTVVGLHGPTARIRADRFEIAGEDARNFSERRWRSVRGGGIGLVLQDALVSLDPLRRISQELGEVLRTHKVVSRGEVGHRSIELLESVGVDDPARRLTQYPHQLSGGLRQRALIATAIAAAPELIIADEPTTALDVTVQAQILRLLEERRDAGNALLLISHDLAVVARLATRVLVMRGGEVVEDGTTEQILGTPTHPYTKQLLRAIPSAATRGRRLGACASVVESTTSTQDSAADAERRVVTPSPESWSSPTTVLAVSDLSKTYRSPGNAPVTVVDGVDFELAAGETLGIVGESGSGKTTVARIALGLVEPDSGLVVLDGHEWTGKSEKERRPLRRLIQSVAQDPLSSFDPRYSVEATIGESLDSVGVVGVERANRVGELLDSVHLSRQTLTRYPRELSGGQRQRVAIARALAPLPRVIVADEPVSALDVSVQAQILDLFTEVRERWGTSLLFISHDLGVVQHISDRVLVMRKGLVVENGSVTEVLRDPTHPYTRALIESIPVLPSAAEHLREKVSVAVAV
ncbi:peptide/nickel transport system ATP-binding protein [Rhodococcus sp. 27YEA15]|uniref:dipeptide ABC transporter ATP-binding protein n=1 Tax=Rhodococcus sp. 27YEA15 TaxID=3156259 RepID=UPI003C7E012D